MRPLPRSCWRFIPARAGNSSAIAGPQHSAVHPRARGTEATLMDALTHGGFILARAGTVAVADHDSGRRRFIPARAGTATIAQAAVTGRFILARGEQNRGLCSQYSVHPRWGTGCTAVEEGHVWFIPARGEQAAM